MLIASAVLAAALGAAEPAAAPRVVLPPPAAAAEPDPTETAALARWIGDWTGTGTQEGKPIQDDMRIEWRHGRRFLHITYIARGSTDNYRSESYVWFNPQRRAYEFFEFNNGIWPVRQHLGTRDGDTWSFEERQPGQHMRLQIQLEADGTMRMEESVVTDGKAQAYVLIRFRRGVAGGGR